MKTHKHLSKEERDKLAVHLAQGFSLRAIAQELDRSHTTLGRELKRNTSGPLYFPHRAQEHARQRLKSLHRRPLKLESDPTFRRHVIRGLKRRWSPEILSGLLALQGLRIAPETIYHWIYSSAKHLAPFLIRHHAKRRPRLAHRWTRQISGRVSVKERPLLANLRLQPGHWETDLVIGRGRSALKVLVERLSRFVRLKKVPFKTAQASYFVLCGLLAKVPPSLRQSITYDNGSENLLHAELNARFPGLRSYFCAPHHAWEKPTVENTNGLIRIFFPKPTNFDIIPDKDIRRVERWLNARPRKCLNFKTSAEVLSSLLVR